MPRHSFVQIQKITNVKGRINYIASHARQENLYATCQTADMKFWKNLARENQQEFVKSGTEGKCIEARELIIALPEVYTEYDPQKILETFTNVFREQYQVECVSALHHNKRKTNYHIHLIFSERQMLPEPEIKTASRNMFYDEMGKHVRTKKEILDENGYIREGCKIIPKGEVYEYRMFTNKNPYFKSDEFLAEEKKLYTELINQHIKKPMEKLQVFDRNSVYLPTKKIGKNNPNAEEILNDNKARQEWNYSVDEALIAGVEEMEILNVKKEIITLQVKKSIAENGRRPGLFKAIVGQAVMCLKSLTDRWKAPIKPVMNVEIKEFRKMRNVKEKLEQQTVAIRQVEQQEIPNLRKELDNVKGIFKSKERKAVEEKLTNAELRLNSMKAYLNTIVRNSGYKTIQNFMQVYKKAEVEVMRYQREVEQYVARGGQKPPEEEGIREKLHRLTKESKQKESDRTYQKKYEKGDR